MYEEYEQFCQKANIRPKSPNVFGKIIKQHFPSVGSSRLGSQRTQKSFYSGIAPVVHDLASAPSSREPTETTTTRTTTLAIALYSTTQTTSPSSPPSAHQQQQPHSPIQIASEAKDQMILSMVQRFFNFPSEVPVFEAKRSLTNPCYQPVPYLGSFVSSPLHINVH